MRVDPSGITPPPVRTGTSTPARPAEPAGGASVGSAASHEGFTPTGELARLLAAAKEAPDVRADVVAAAAARLEAGELDTPAAAADTARAMRDAAGE